MSEIIAPNKVQHPPSASLSDKYVAGVRTYASGYYDPDYEPKETDLLCAFRITPKPPDGYD